VIAERPKLRIGVALHPVTWALLVFSFVNFAGSSAVVILFSPQNRHLSTRGFAVQFARGIAGDDSWTPMRIALEEARGARGDRIYRTLFFERGIKFQYPPSSLLALDLVDWLSGGRLSVGLLNTIGWFFVLALALVVPAIYLGALREFQPGLWNSFTSLDRAVQAVVGGLMTLTFYPVTRAFVLGQVQAWLTTLFALAVLAWIRKQEGLSGALIGLIVTVKPPLAVLLLWGATQRRRAFVIAAAVTVLVLESIAVWRYGLQNHIDYLSVLAYLSAHGESYFANQSVNGLVGRLLQTADSQEFSFQTFPPFHPVVYYATLVSSALMIGLALLWRRRDPRPRAMVMKLAVASTLVTMASPIAWLHHYGILIAVFAVILPLFLGDPPSRLGDLSRRGWLICLGVSYVASSNTFPFADQAADPPWNIVQSYLFAGAGLLVLSVCLRGVGGTRRVVLNTRYRSADRSARRSQTS
jgi:alpha-1,2-mannosyltransferase